MRRKEQYRSFRAFVVLTACVVCWSCRDSVAPDAVVWDEWPWMETSIASRVVAVTGTSTAQAPGMLRVSARFVNPGSDSVRVEHGACSFGVRLREVNGRALMPVVWDNRPAGGACILPLFWFYVPAGGTHEVRVADVRASALVGVVPGAEYHVNVVWRNSATGSVQEVSAGVLVVSSP